MGRISGKKHYWNYEKAKGKILDFIFEENVSEGRTHFSLREISENLKEEVNFEGRIKLKFLFNLKPDYRNHLKEGHISNELRKEFKVHKYPISINAQLLERSGKWFKLVDGINLFRIEDIGKNLKIYYAGLEINDNKKKRFTTINLKVLGGYLDRMINEGILKKEKYLNSEYKYTVSHSFFGIVVTNYEAKRSIVRIQYPLDELEKIWKHKDQTKYKKKYEKLINELNGYNPSEIFNFGGGITYYSLLLNKMNDSELASFYNIDKRYNKCANDLYQLNKDVVLREMTKEWELFRNSKLLQQHQSLIDDLYNAYVGALKVAEIYFIDYDILYFEGSEKGKNDRRKKWEKSRHRVEVVKKLESAVRNIEREGVNTDNPEKACMLLTIYMAKMDYLFKILGRLRIITSPAAILLTQLKELSKES